jgi:general secretion pathway protein N
LGVLAYVVLALVTLPASVVIPRVQPSGVVLAGLDGSVWNGSAEALQVAGIHVGSLEWNLHVLKLFALRVAADIKLKRTDGFAQGGVSVGKRRVDLDDFSASLPLNLLPPQFAPGGWTGTANARLARLTVVDGWPVSADGTIDIVNLTGPARRPANLGSFQVKFPVQSNEANTLVGSVSDVDGPLKIAGKIQLKSTDRSYLLEGLVATKPDAPAEFARTLEFLGPPDAQGRRQFSLSGTM